MNKFFDINQTINYDDQVNHYCIYIYVDDKISFTEIESAMIYKLTPTDYSYIVNR